MTWTYDNTLATDRDIVRFRVGDTNSANELLQDEELDAILASQTHPLLAAAVAADALAAKFAFQVNTTHSRLSVGAAERYDHYIALGKKLRKEAAGTPADNPFASRDYALAVPKVGGIKRSDKEALDNNTDNTQPSFKKTRNDNPGTGERHAHDNFFFDW